MRTGAGGSWLAVGLLLGCGLSPSEVVGVYEGQGSSSSGGSADGPGTDGVGSASTGPVADATGGSDTGTPSTSAEGDTNAVDPSTTDPDTAPGSTGPASTSGEPGSSSGPPPLPPTCTEVFGTASGYVLCTEGARSCAFNVNTGGNDCNAICGMFGAACLDDLDNNSVAGEECIVQPADLNCASLGKSTTICVCAFP
jgi:hypothetical protein